MPYSGWVPATKMEDRSVPTQPSFRETEFRTLNLDGQLVQTAIERGDRSKTPLLLMNGIGARLELFQPLVDQLDPDREIIRFDVPGVGASPAPRWPYRMHSMARLVSRMLDSFGYDKVDTLGISWGGALAQQFAFSQRSRCRRLVLVSTATGMIMVPAHPRVLAKMATPRRYRDPDHLENIAGEIYGGHMRANPELASNALRAHRAGYNQRGYFLQLAAGLGWTSVPFLPFVKQETLILTGTDDPIVPASNATIMGRLIPNSRVHIFHDGHLGLLTEGPDLARRIEEFLTVPAAELVSTRKTRSCPI